MTASISVGDMGLFRSLICYLTLVPGICLENLSISARFSSFVVVGSDDVLDISRICCYVSFFISDFVN